MANKAILTGNLGADAQEMKSGDGSKTFARLRVATQESWPKGDGSYETRTDWHTVVVFSEPLAKSLIEKAKKGDQVYVEGKLRTNTQERDGVKYEQSDIIIDQQGKYETLSRAADRPARSQSGSAEGDAPASTTAAATDDEIPF